MPIEELGGMDFGANDVSFALTGAGALGAAVVGFTGSTHCALMCGPLSCGPLPLGKRARLRAGFAWHAGRAGAYVLVGLGAGLAGEGAARVFAGAIAPALPWVMSAALVASALELGKRLPSLPLLARTIRAGRRAGEKLTPGLRSAALGALTPLLPCGFLYGAVLAAVATGRILGGAAVMGAFALGTLPALAAVQMHAQLLAGHPRALRVARKAVPLLAAAALVWRATHAGGGGEPPQCH